MAWWCEFRRLGYCSRVYPCNLSVSKCPLWKCVPTQYGPINIVMYDDYLISSGQVAILRTLALSLIARCPRARSLRPVFALFPKFLHHFGLRAFQSALDSRVTDSLTSCSATACLTFCRCFLRTRSGHFSILRPWSHPVYCSIPPSSPAAQYLFFFFFFPPSRTFTPSLPLTARTC